MLCFYFIERQSSLLEAGPCIPIREKKMVLFALIFIFSIQIKVFIFLLHRQIRIYLIFSNLIRFYQLNSLFRGKYFFFFEFTKDFSFF
jgi:hypothetical protein